MNFRFVVITGLLACILLSSVYAAGPADTAWPMYFHDARHTGRSQYAVGINEPATDWQRDDIYVTPMCTSTMSIDLNGDILIGGRQSHDRVVAINKTTGLDSWTYEASNGVGNTPAIDDSGNIYFCTGTSWPGGARGLTKIDTTPAELWQYVIGSFSCGCSPVIGPDGMVYWGGDDGYIHSTYPDGTQNWQSSMGGITRSSPSLDSDGNVYIASYDSSLHCYYGDGTGQKWSYAIGRFYLGAPTISDDESHVFIGSQNKILYCLNTSDGSLVWQKSLSGYTCNTGCLAPDGTYYFTVGYSEYALYAMNPDTGETLWTYTPPGDYPYPSAPVVDSDGIVYITSRYGTYAISPDGSELWFDELIYEGGPYDTPNPRATIIEQGAVYSQWLVQSMDGPLENYINHKKNVVERSSNGCCAATGSDARCTVASGLGQDDEWEWTILKKVVSAASPTPSPTATNSPTPTITPTPTATGTPPALPAFGSAGIVILILGFGALLAVRRKR